MLENLPRLSSFVGALAMFAALRAEADVVINEILYRPGTTYPENTNLEFIELLNTGAAPVDLTGWAFTKGIAYTFPAGSCIAAGGYAVVGANPTALRAAYGIANVGNVESIGYRGFLRVLGVSADDHVGVSEDRDHTTRRASK